MATLGALLSQQSGFTVSTTAGTVYTHGLGFTPTFVIITNAGTVISPVTAVGYTLLTSNTVTLQATGLGTQIVDVICGSFHSLIK